MKIITTRQPVQPKPEKNVIGSISFQDNGLLIRLSYDQPQSAKQSIQKIKAIPALMTPLQLN